MCVPYAGVIKVFLLGGPHGLQAKSVISVVWFKNSGSFNEWKTYSEVQPNSQKKKKVLLWTDTFKWLKNQLNLNQNPMNQYKEICVDSILIVESMHFMVILIHPPLDAHFKIYTFFILLLHMRFWIYLIPLQIVSLLYLFEYPWKRTNNINSGGYIINSQGET